MRRGTFFNKSRFSAKRESQKSESPFFLCSKFTIRKRNFRTKRRIWSVNKVNQECSFETLMPIKNKLNFTSRIYHFMTTEFFIKVPTNKRAPLLAYHLSIGSLTKISNQREAQYIITEVSIFLDF